MVLNKELNDMSGKEYIIVETNGGGNIRVTSPEKPSCGHLTESVREENQR